MKDKLVNLHIIGAQKCGTTALAHFLHEHDDIYVVDEKEAHIFDSAQFIRSKHKAKFAQSAYATKMKSYRDEKFICDATPITWFDTRFLTHCYAYNKQAKFILILRDPVERAYSHYKMSCNKSQETHSFLIALLLEHFRMKKHRDELRFQSPYRTQSYLSRGRYTYQLKRVFDLVPINQILVLYQEELSRNHESTLDLVFKFLELSPKQIQQKKIFSRPKQSTTIGELLGKMYARAYFYFRGENKRRWQSIIENAQGNIGEQN